MLDFSNVFPSVFNNSLFQVSLVAVQLIGDEASVTDTSTDNSISVCVNDELEKPHYMSVCDDLAFEMYVDKDVARIIRLLEARKHQAVQGAVQFIIKFY